MPAGRRFTNSRAACCAAASRLGLTSVAFIEPDVSTAMSTVARWRGTLTACVGSANPTTSNSKAISTSPAAMWRCQPGTARRDRREQVDAREAHDVLLARVQHDEVRDEQQQRRDDEREASGRIEVHDTPVGSRRLVWRSMRRRIVTNRAMSRSQSRSVESVRCSAPPDRMSRAIRSSRSRAARS